MRTSTYSQYLMAALVFCLTVPAALFSTGCIDSDTESKAVRSAVREYNDALKDAYYRMGPEPLVNVATMEEQHRNEIIMEKFRYEKTRMISTIQEFTFESVTIEIDRAYARTNEIWSVEKVDSRTGRIKNPKEIINYHLEYRLVKDNMGSWLVDKVSHVEPQKK